MALPPRILLPGSHLAPGVVLPTDEALSHRLLHVLRLREGGQVRICDGQGRCWNAMLERDGRRWNLRVEGPAPGEPEEDRPERPLILVMGLLKGDRTEWAVQKATEIGVSSIHAVVMRHSIPRPRGPDLLRKAARLERVAREAARQCGRALAPEVRVWNDLDAALAALESPGSAAVSRFLLDERPGARPLSVGLRGARGAVLAVGPEGSFHPEEREMLEHGGFSPAGLGPRVLRAETAVIAGLVVFQVVCGDLGEAFSCTRGEKER